MANPIPKWIQIRYAYLWNKFKDRSFTHDQAVKLLRDNGQVTSVFLSDLKKAGWLEVNLDPKDTRIRLYNLISPEQAIKELKNDEQ
jgi:biotin-(acetyl-CoA carboxylase) ligase